jgi:hypothetical protein
MILVSPVGPLFLYGASRSYRGSRTSASCDAPRQLPNGLWWFLQHPQTNRVARQERQNGQFWPNPDTGGYQWGAL